MADTKVLETTVEQNQMNQIEVLEFRLDGKAFGINIGKVREIIEYHPITPMPKTHPGIEGVFMPRDTMITAVDLKICLGIGESEKKGKYILTNFNNLNIAFHVDEVVGIHRIAWKDIMIPEATSSSYDNGNITGVVKVANRLMVIPDFETLMADINPEIGIKINDMDKLGDREYNEISVLVVEDSSLMNKLLLDALKQAGYHRLIHAENGQQYRILNESWWKQELPTEEEMQEGRKNLEKVNYKIDYVISHCMSTTMQETLEALYCSFGFSHRCYEADILTDYFEELEQKLQYKHWYCGHYHVNQNADEKHTVLYEKILPIGAVLEEDSYF